MDFNQLHFAQPLWLWMAIAIPLVGILYFFFYQPKRLHSQLETFIDKHLLPYLLMNQPHQKHSLWKSWLTWSTVWLCLTISLAGPRWSFREIETFSKDQSLVILLDLSESMNATDIKPSRLRRAKEKIEDMINILKGVKIGLIGFAADPHMLTPLTDDKETIRHLLPSIGTELVYVQGSRLSSAIDMAAMMLNAEPGFNKSLLIISDGGFEDASAMTTAKNLAEKGVMIHAMGVGTVAGAPLQDHEGNVIKKNGIPLLSKLEKEKLSEISRIGKGHYLEANHSDNEEMIILQEFEKRADIQLISKKTQLWDEHFYLFILPILPIILLWCRREYLFTLHCLFFVFMSNQIEATIFSSDYFKNSEQIGKEALEKEDYEAASKTFQDSYRKGIAYYKMGNFPEAEKMFRESSREEVASHAAYNLGNALVQQQKFKEAITAYEDLLKKWPDHTKAKENLELIKKMVEEQQENSQSDEGQDKNENSEHSGNQDQKESKDEKGSKDENQKKNQDSNDSHQPKQQQDHDPSQIENQDSKEEQEREEEQEKKQNQQMQKEKDSDSNPAQPPTMEEQQAHGKSQEELDADLWLNQITNDPKQFLQNKFYIESKKNGTKEGIDPW